ARSRPADGYSAQCSALLSPIAKKPWVEEERPRPSRFEHWRASKSPSRHFKPPRDGGLVRPDERSSATHGIVIPDERVCEVRDLERRAKRPQAHKSARSARIQFGQQPSAARHSRRSRFQKHGKSGVTTPTTNLLKMVFWSCAYVPLAGIRM